MATTSKLTHREMVDRALLAMFPREIGAAELACAPHRDLTEAFLAAYQVYESLRHG